MQLGLPQLHGHFAHPRRGLPTGTARQEMSPPEYTIRRALANRYGAIYIHICG